MPQAITSEPISTRAKRSRRSRAIHGVYNSKAQHDPTATAKQRIKILEIFRSNPNQPFSVKEMAHAIGSPDSLTSTSASIRDLRKPKFGGFQIASGYDKDGVFKYRYETEACHV